MKNNIAHFIAVHENVTARKNAEQKALYLADHDSLTGLPNRRYFERHLHQILKNPGANGYGSYIYRSRSF